MAKQENGERERRAVPREEMSQLIYGIRGEEEEKKMELFVLAQRPRQTRQIISKPVLLPCLSSFPSSPNTRGGTLYRGRGDQLGPWYDKLYSFYHH